ncbi:hypothetical protein [Brevibacillus gelatini]|uniref:Uncharacterized protein n=1 Tax=Brevibacillus gelatini TaxID=1655277 RepID=A0A3M8AX25_9BACL|nr:hypothetical protein [Brevibacillus gelatini]RNB55630.1 hypothetical protein EDM57_14870 [Brevibacillus gelatini]
MKKLASSLVALILALGFSTSAFAAVYQEYEPNDKWEDANSFYAAHGNQINGKADYYNSDRQDRFTFVATQNQKIRLQLAYSKAGGQVFTLKVRAGGKTYTTTPTKDYVDFDIEAGKEYRFEVYGEVFNLDYNNFNYSVYCYVLPN